MQAAETEALQMHEAALALLSLPAPAGAAATAVQAGEPEPAATPAPVLGPKRGQSPQVSVQSPGQYMHVLTATGKFTFAKNNSCFARFTFACCCGKP